MNTVALGAVVAAYVCGSFPSAYIAGRWLKGVDLRTIGSGNLGATNVYRELGVGAALVVLAADMLKGAVPTLLLPPLLSGVSGESAAAWWALAIGAATIAGHAKPVFLLWKGGGKGVATAAGVFLALTPIAMGICLLVFLVVAVATRFISLASIVAAAVLPLAQWGTGSGVPATVASTAIAVFVIWAHRKNVARLRAGTEPKFGRPPQVAA